MKLEGHKNLTHMGVIARAGVYRPCHHCLKPAFAVCPINIFQCTCIAIKHTHTQVFHENLSTCSKLKWEKDMVSSIFDILK